MFWQGMFASAGNSAAVGALLNRESNVIDAATLVPIGVFCACAAVILGIVGHVCYKRGKDDQKMSQIMYRLKELEDKESE